MMLETKKDKSRGGGLGARDDNDGHDSEEDVM
jgi:hypothetical protein